MTYSQFARVRNPQYQEDFVKESLQSFISQFGRNATVLDIGAGTGRFRDLVVSLGLKYVSQDFGQYVPRASAAGLHDQEWGYLKLDYECDVLDLPNSISAEIVLCTEVLEHVADPVEVLKKLRSLTKPGGRVLITVPFISLMHHAPHYYSSGLSPFWFEEHAARVDFQSWEIRLYGDYFDLVLQEVKRVYSFSSIFLRFVFYPLRLISLVSISLARKFAPKETASYAGFGTAFIGDVSSK